MSDLCAIKLEKSIKSVAVLLNYNDGSSSANETNKISAAEQSILAKENKAKKDLYDNLCKNLQNLIAKIDQFYDGIFVNHKSEIARLSVEIARKVLMQKIKDRDYEIEAIINEAINHSPSHKDLTIHLNPQDLADLRESQKNSGEKMFDNLRFVADSSVGAAECIIESPKGKIKSMINDHLEEIGKALKISE